MILVTGGAGFIGGHLVAQLVDHGVSVRVLDLPGRDVSRLPKKVDVAFADIRNRRSVAKAMAGCDAVYHLAANPQLWTRRKGHYSQVNYDGTINVLDCAMAADVRRIVHVSTESILTRSRQTSPIAEDQHVPLREVIGPYCRSKWRAEQYAFKQARNGAAIVVVNPTLPIGPGDHSRTPPTQMILDAALGKRSIYLDAELNMIDARDVASGIIAAMEHGQPGRRYLLGSENWTIRRLFDWVAQQSGVAGPRWQIPYPVALTAAVVSEWIADTFTGKIPAALVTGVRLTRRTMRFEPRRSLSELGITPRPVEESLGDTLRWFREKAWM